MNERVITPGLLAEFEISLKRDEKSVATVKKYMREVCLLAEFAAGRQIEKDVILKYKNRLPNYYKASSANCILAAVNSFLRFAGWCDCIVKQFKVQKQTFRPEEKELTKAEYLRLVKTAEKRKNLRLSLIIQTVCSCGIRVSELKYITVEAVKSGEANVRCKGKSRKIFIVTALRQKLLKYCREKGIKSGAIFITSSGKAMDRSNIWREMKSLCHQAEVNPNKVFPHNLRHLFARTFYGIEKDIAKLADILGHSNINTTRIYILTTGAEHRRKMENMRLII